MEVEKNIRISKLDVTDNPRAKAEVKKEKSKDQHEETLPTILKKMEKFTKEANSRDRFIMNKITALERAQKSSYVRKGKPFPKKKNKEDRPNLSQFPNALASTNCWARLIF